MKTIQLTSLKFEQMFDVTSMLMEDKNELFRPTAESPINHILGWVLSGHFEDTLKIS